MRFECNQNTNEEYRVLIDAIHEEDDQYSMNWEIVSRMWITKENETIMIEHQVMTTKGKKTLESFNEPDWLGAYIVDDENDDDCSHPIDMTAISPDVSLEHAKIEMENFANKLFKEE